MSDENVKERVIEVKSDNRALWVIVAFLAFGALTFFILVSAIATAVGGDVRVSDQNIGVVEVKGVIENADKFVTSVRTMNSDDTIKAILIRINSPGGSVSASQEMVEAIQTIKKPVAISMGDMAASGGYYVACAGPKIFANPGTLTGSIGVISQLMEFSELLDFFNIKVNTVKTGDLKDSGSPYREFNKQDRAYFEQLGLDLYDQFINQVATARKMPREKIMPLADGRALSGKQAKEAGLVDELGGLNAAIEYLKTEANVPDTFELIYPPSSQDWVEALLAEGSAQAGQAIKAGTEALLHDAHQPFQYLYQP